MTGITGVPDALARALRAHGYNTLTPVQRAVLAVEPQSRDMLVSAKTGTGKTLAFGLALASVVLGPEGRAAQKKAPKAIVITPTRELAHQVKDELGWLFSETGGRIVCCTGGMDMRAERTNLLAGCEVVVGSPGRLRDHIERGGLDTSNITCVVLDEADDMLDLGFRDDLQFIIKSASPSRQTLMFSATVTKRVEDLAASFQTDAMRVRTDETSDTPSTIRFQGIEVAPNDRENAIVNILRFHNAQCAMVFCARRETVAHLASRLDNRGFKVVSLSGAMPQKERSAAMASMRDGRARVCVATDLAARGLDLPRLELVIHADLPESPAVLTHRSGRTGRAGRDGLAVLVVSHTERRSARALISRAKLDVEWVEPPSPEAIRAKDIAQIFAATELMFDITLEERDTAQRLLVAFEAENVAVAYLRNLLASHPAPEVLIGSMGDLTRIARPRITDGVWFSLNCGQVGKAEVRWILPLICRLGHLTKRDIGRIIIRETETRFEISASKLKEFTTSLALHEEPGVEIRRIDAAQPEPEHPGIL